MRSISDLDEIPGCLGGGIDSWSGMRTITASSISLHLSCPAIGRKRGGKPFPRYSGVRIEGKGGPSVSQRPHPLGGGLRARIGRPGFPFISLACPSCLRQIRPRRRDPPVAEERPNNESIRLAFVLFLRAQEKDQKKGSPQGLSRISKPRFGRDGTRRAGKIYPPIPLILSFGKNLLCKALEGRFAPHPHGDFPKSLRGPEETSYGESLKGIGLTNPLNFRLFWRQAEIDV